MDKGTRTFGYRGETWKIFTVPPTHRYLKKDKHGRGPYIGRCLHSRKHLFLSEGQTPKERADTLLHELIHVVLRPTVQFNSDVNEALVEAIAPGLAVILTQLVTGLER